MQYLHTDWKYWSDLTIFLLQHWHWCNGFLVQYVHLANCIFGCFWLVGFPNDLADHEQSYMYIQLLLNVYFSKRLAQDWRVKDRFCCWMNISLYLNQFKVLLFPCQDLLLLANTASSTQLSTISIITINSLKLPFYIYIKVLCPPLPPSPPPFFWFGMAGAGCLVLLSAP